MSSPGGSLTASIRLPCPSVASICRFSCSPYNRTQGELDRAQQSRHGCLLMSYMQHLGSHWCVLLRSECLGGVPAECMPGYQHQLCNGEDAHELDCLTSQAQTNSLYCGTSDCRALVYGAHKSVARKGGCTGQLRKPRGSVLDWELSEAL